MLLSSFLLFVAFTYVIADAEHEFDRCTNMLENNELKDIAKAKSDDVEHLCPMLLDFFSCFEDFVQRETGMTTDEIAAMLEGTEEGRITEMIVNVRNVIQELCTEGTPLNTAYKADAECYDSMEDPTDLCEKQALAAYEVYREVVENAEEAADDDDDPNKECMQLAYQSACMASAIHDTCGRRAFNTYNTVVKRTSVFKNALCSTESLEDLKTSFLDSLGEEDVDKELFRLAFDLRKRRK